MSNVGGEVPVLEGDKDGGGLSDFGDEAPAVLDDDTHRGGFGEFGADGGGLIDRAFRERIVLVAVARDNRCQQAVEASLDELALLVDTAGADAVERVCQRRAKPDPATFVGSGKAREIRALAEEVDCDTVVFDDDLTPAQQFNLENLLGRTALDRTAVILDIFAQNASTPEGRAQVELAQLRYRLPRLRGSGRRLSQQAGGIGTRGPGETQLEVDRRRIERRIHKLEEDLRGIARHRRTQSKARRRTRNVLASHTATGYEVQNGAQHPSLYAPAALPASWPPSGFASPAGWLPTGWRST